MPIRRKHGSKPIRGTLATCESLECLESRWMLSTASVSKIKHVPKRADLIAPPAAEVATAQSILAKTAGPAFTQLTSDLSNLENASRVTPGEFNTLEYFATQLDKSIESANMSGAQMQRQLFELQDVIDTSFLGGGFSKANWSALQQQMGKALKGISVTSALIPQTLSGAVPLSSTSSQMVRDTFTQMRVVGREAHVTLAEHASIVADEKAIYAALGSQVDTNVGASTPRDPVIVYYDGQVNDFVHNKE